MEELCRLCAVFKHPEEFKCKIDDQLLDIERKLITCCNWNSYRSHQNLPNGVCISCFLQLEQCWYFRESVSRAQLKLCTLMQIDLQPRALLECQNSDRKSYENALGIDTQEIHVKVENPTDEIVDVGPIEVTDLKIEDDNESDTNDNHYDDSDGRFSEDNFSAAISKVEKVKKTKTKTKSNAKKEKVKRKNAMSNSKKFTSNVIEFDIKKILSHQDVNDDGTIKPEKIVEQNFCDWTTVKNRCYKCNDDFNTHSDLWVHFTSTHSNEKINFICPICPVPVTFLSGRYYREHIAKIHHPHLTYCCHKCQKFFYDKKKMRDHLRSHPKNPSISVCSTCGKGFSYYKNLHFHMLSHLPVELQPQYECYLCKKSLKSHQSLQKHIKFHIGVFKSAICDQCGKAFATASKLKKHMTMHTDERPFSCETCFKTFKTSSILRRHRRIHQDFKAYVCDICAHRTLDKSALKLHIIRYHTDESPFPCDICGKKFYSARTMKTHQKNMHFEHRPFPCNLCDHRAVNLNALQRHHKHVHLDHRPHACNLCEYRTYSKHNLRLHTSRRHAQIEQPYQQQQQQLQQQIEPKFTYTNMS